MLGKWFDIIYALQDEDFDRSKNLHSIPAYLGKVNALRLSTFLHVLSAVFIMMPAFETHVGFLYYIGIAFLLRYAGLSAPAGKTK
jgi:4-hydroxybenzoate polyprenyltransferase